MTTATQEKKTTKQYVENVSITVTPPPTEAETKQHILDTIRSSGEFVMLMPVIEAKVEAGEYEILEGGFVKIEVKG